MGTAQGRRRAVWLRRFPVPQTALRQLDVVLTSDCNLRCKYCYQNAKRPGVMQWNTLRAALDLLLRTTREKAQIYFVGGEPLLAFGLVEKAVAYVERRRRRSLEVTYALATNGLLLRSRHLRFLARHRFGVKLSFDGVSRMQRLRKPATFHVLDRLLSRIRDQHPSLFANGLKIAVALVPETVDSFAATVRYFLRKGVWHLQVGAAMMDGRGWNGRLDRRLRKEYAAVFRCCLQHYGRTGRVPFELFRRSPDHVRPLLGDWYCGVGTGEALTVDVDGTVHGCVLLASSYQRFPATRVGRSLAGARVGKIHDADLPRRMAAYRRHLEHTGVFNNRHRKYSSYGRCATCQSRFGCVVCPMMVVHGSSGRARDRVPDFVCAFNRLSHRYRNRFPAVLARPSRDIVYADLMRQGREFLASRRAARLRKVHDC